ncbi:hypothetical protein ACWIGW_34910 [Nocardia brasiliensis]
MDLGDKGWVFARLAETSAEIAEIVAGGAAVRETGNRKSTPAIGAGAQRAGWASPDLHVLRSILSLPTAPEPYSVSELAERINIDTEAVRRVLVWMVREHADEVRQQ